MSDRAIVEIDEAFLRRAALPQPAGDTDKESRGRVVVIGGGSSSPGAVVLSGLGALRSGAGKLQLCVPHSLAAAVGMAIVEAGIRSYSETREGEPADSAWRDVRESAERAKAVLIGPGLMDERAANQLAIGLLANVIGPTFVLDAMALCGLDGAADVLARHAGRIVLTPHAGEMAKLTGRTKEQVTADPVPIALETAKRLTCVVVLKGAVTHIATPEGAVFRHSSGVVGLATAGSGDVLAGIMAGLLARGADPVQASAWSVFVHAQAGDRLTTRIGSLGFIASEIAGEVPGLLDRLR